MQTTAWLFLLGWAAARADTTGRRVLVSAVALAATPGFFFDEPVREALVAGGVLALTWLPTVAVPRPLVRLVRPLAAASLWIYLTHWQVYPRLRGTFPPAVGVLASLAVGVAAWWAVGRLGDAVRRRRAAQPSACTSTRWAASL